MEITPELLLNAYANGYFPMAMAEDDPELYWFSPEERGVLPLDEFHIPRGLKRALKSRDYTVTIDRDFAGVIRGCGEINGTRDGTWINQQIIDLYNALYAMGHAHSVEVWASRQVNDFLTSPLRGEVGATRRVGVGGGALNLDNEKIARLSPPPQPSPLKGEAAVPIGRDSANEAPSLPLAGGAGEGISVPPFQAPESGEGKFPPLLPPASGGNVPRLIGGLYGVSLGGAFFGESMFSRAADASKIALVTLVEILREAEYELLDTQYVNEHLKQFGVMAVPKVDYMGKLASALKASPNPSTRFSTVSVRKGLASASSERIT